jgi:tRNA1Val (adenine37-N6)-methyltransferase
LLERRAGRGYVAGVDSVSPRGGIVRAARRPPGWIASGPPPEPPADLTALWPDPDEDLCWLAGDWRILQRQDGHRFSLDDLVTAYTAASLLAARPPRRLLDLGCGIGTVLLFLTWRFPEAQALGIEAQELSAGMAARSIAWNGAGARCRVRHADFREPGAIDAPGTFELCTGTPPYFPRGTGLESDHVQRGPCRFEHRGGVEAYAEAAVAALAPGAPFVMCASSLQVPRVLACAPALGLGIERRRDVVPRAGKPPLFSVFVLRARDACAAHEDEPPLVVRDAEGRRTSDFVAVRAAMGMPP